MNRYASALVFATSLLVWWLLVEVSVPVAGHHTSTAANTTALMAAPAPAGFARALEARPFRFPRDHGAHPRFRSEWWYFTGHLNGEDGRDFGFQLTLFRFETDAETAPADVGATQDATASRWRTPRVMLGHFAVSDLTAQRFHAFERVARAVGEQAGASPSGPRLAWLDDWTITYHAEDARWELVAAHAQLRLSLSLTAASAPVAQGERGLSRKSATPGNASYYYSIPRLRAAGELERDGERTKVSGSAWLDREWSTSALDRHQRGWDWFALQLEDGANLMFYRLRRADGSADAFSSGSLVLPDGEVIALAANAVTLATETHWRSPKTGVRYPARWRLSIPAHGRDYHLVPRLDCQEWRQRFRYWEGAVKVIDAASGAAAGLGYVELTGY